MMYRKSSTTLKQTRYFITMAIAALILAVFVPSMSAEEKPAVNSGWDFQVAPYMWFLSLDGDVTVKGQKSDLDLDFSDIWDELNIAGMLTFDARKGNWGIFGDVIGANLGKSKKVGDAKIDPTIKLAMLTAGGGVSIGHLEAVGCGPRWADGQR